MVEYILCPGNLVVTTVTASGPWSIQELGCGYVPPLGGVVPVLPASACGASAFFTVKGSSSMTCPSTAMRKL